MGKSGFNVFNAFCTTRLTILIGVRGPLRNLTSPIIGADPGIQVSQLGGVRGNRRRCGQKGRRRSLRLFAEFVREYVLLISGNGARPVRP